MREAIASETDKDTHPDDLNNYKFHLCICEKPIYSVILEEKAIFLINKGSSGDWEM